MERMVYFSINAADLHSMLNETPGAVDGLNLNIILQDGNQITPNFIKQLSQLKGFFIFSLSSSFIKVIDEKLLCILYAVISLDNYFRFIEGNAIIIQSESNQHDKIKSEVACFFENQGVKLMIAFILKIEKDVITENGLILFLPENIFVDEDLQYKLLRKLISDEDHSFILITAMNPQLFRNFQKQGPGTGKWLPVLRKLLQMKFEMNKFIGSTQDYKRRSLLYLEFLMLSKKVQEKEYYDLYNWYHKEYEVLPLWYKRLGHVIKVISGKRTFKSLFAGKIKKMKI